MSTEKENNSYFVRGDLWAALGGLFAIGIAVAVRYVIGSASSYEARVLLKSLIAGGLYLVSTTGAASATIIALMLTAVGLTRNANARFSDVVYGQIRWISILSAIVLAGSIFALLLMSVPLDQADNIPRGWVKGIYYTVSALIAALSGMMIALVIMLLTTVLGIIKVVAPDAGVSDDDAEDAGAAPDTQ